jgi:hypothetical protein
MRRYPARARVQAARAELDQVEQRVLTRWQSWHERLDRHRLSLLIGSGLVGGFMLAAVPPNRWSRVGAAVFGSGARLARSPIGPALLAAFWTTMLDPPASPCLVRAAENAGATSSGA